MFHFKCHHQNRVYYFGVFFYFSEDERAIVIHSMTMWEPA